MTDPQVPIVPPPAEPPQSRAILRGFLVSSAISAGVAIVGAATLTVGIGIVIIVPFALVQLAWTLPLFFSYRKQGKRGESKGVLISCAVNVLLSIACFGYLTTHMDFK